MKHTTTLFITAEPISYWDTPTYVGQKYLFNVRDHDSTLGREVLIGTKEFTFETDDNLDITPQLIDSLEEKIKLEQKESQQRVNCLLQEIETLRCLEAPES